MFWKKKKAVNTGEAYQQPGNVLQDPVPIQVVIKTDLGNVRNNNEDRASFIRMTDDALLRDKGYLLMVADGMGGHNAGEVASNMAVEIISEEYYKKVNEKSKEKILAAAFQNANKKIFQQSSSSEQYRGMGTTCTAVVIIANAIYYAHVGDSRAYLYKDNKISRLTQDHTFVQELVNKGDISAEQAETHPQRNVLTNAMGTKSMMRVDTGISTLPFEENDRLLLCSDGLYDYLSDMEIAAGMDKPDLQEVADYFIAEAKRRGGKDNITVVLAAFPAVNTETTVKETRMADRPVITRDAEIPPDINTSENDR